MRATDRYWILKCNNCGRYILYENRGGKNKKKVCPYCMKSFTIIPKSKPTYSIIKTTDDIIEAIAIIKYLKENAEQKI